MAEGTTVLTELSDALANAVAKAGASTVMVNARRRIPASGVVWSNDGVIVTSDHVVEREDDISIGLADGSTVKAQLVGRDPGSDIAILRIDAGKAPGAQLAAEASRIGHLVLAVGRPVEGDVMASFGVVGAVGGAWRTFRGGTVEGYIRSDVTFYPGFSGGPLVDGEGRVVGINSSRLGRGAGLTIPAAAVSQIVEQLLKGGKIRRGYLGIGSQPVRIPATIASKLGREQETGLLVVGVETGSAAEKGGLLVGDILVAFGEALLQDTDDLQTQLRTDSVGQPKQVAILRGGEPKTLTITVGERE
ncbi:MAG: trypsin-like peptidase domain-containing protein [Dehalococcoidia bacterium]